MDKFQSDEFQSEARDSLHNSFVHLVASYELFDQDDDQWPEFWRRWLVFNAAVQAYGKWRGSP